MNQGEDDAYRRTAFDRHGPEAAHRNQILSSLIIPIVAGALIGGALGAKKDLSPPLIALSALIGAALLGGWWWFFVTRVSHGAGKAFGEFIQPSGDRTPYEQQYSEQDAMVMRGNVAGALASFEEIILASPNEPRPKLRAADLYVKNGQWDRAEALYRAVQRIPDVAAKDDIYATNRLADLYLQWPDREARALTELRKIIDRYPDTELAQRARTGLANLKSHLGTAE